MERPAYLFDGRNLLSEEDIRSIGFLYYRVGKKFKHVSWLQINYRFYFVLMQAFESI